MGLSTAHLVVPQELRLIFGGRNVIEEVSLLLCTERRSVWRSTLQRFRRGARSGDEAQVDDDGGAPGRGEFLMDADDAQELGRSVRSPG